MKWIHSLINKLRITRLTLTNFPTSLTGVTKYNTKYKLWGTLEYQSNPNKKIKLLNKNKNSHKNSVNRLLLN